MALQLPLRIFFLWLVMIASCSTVQAKNGSVKGRITNQQTREGLIGASILLTPRETARANEYVYAFQDMRVTMPVLSGDDSRPQRTGAIALNNGTFEVSNVRAGEYQLTVRSLGFKTYSVPVTVRDNETLDVQTIGLVSDIQGTDAVVITGVASKRQKSVSETAIGRVDAVTLTENMRFSDPAQLLVGKISGLNVAPSSGIVGTGIRLTVRSNAGLLGGQPIIFLDGTRLLSVDYYKVFEVDELSPLINLSPDDIESIEVLKGPASACLYGTAAQNGIVLINTKRGRKKNGLTPELTVNYQYATGWQEPSRLYTEDMTLSYQSVNRAFRQAPMAQHFLNLSGAVGAMSYYASFERRDDNGILPLNSMGRTSGRVNMDITVAQGLSAKLSANAVQNDSRLPLGFDQIESSLLRNLLLGNEAAGKRFFFSDSAAIMAVDNRLSVEQFIGSAELTYTPAIIEGLRFRGLVGIENNHSRFLTYFPPGFRFSPNDARMGGTRSIRSSYARRFNIDASVSYSREIVEGLTVNSIIGTQLFDNYFGSDFSSATNFQTPLVQALQTGSGISATEFFSHDRQAGIFGRVETNFRETYFLSFGGRNDYASTLGFNVPSIFYPQISGAVRLDKTGLLHGEWNLFKVRAAFAESGRLPSLDQSLRSWQLFFGSGSSIIGPVLNQLYLRRAGSPDIRPERIQEIEIGVDVEIANRWGLEFTYFQQNSRDAILNTPTPPSVGVGGVPQNIGGISGWGFESQVYGKIVNEIDHDVMLSGIVNYSDNIITNIGASNSIFSFGAPVRTNFIAPGMRRGEFMDFLPLRPQFLPNGYYDWLRGAQYDTMRTALGSTVPLWTGSLALTYRFLQDFTLYAMVDFGVGKNMLNITRQENIRVGNDKRFNELLTALGLARGQAADNNMGIAPVQGVTVLQPNTVEYRAASEEFMRLDPGRGIVGNFLERADWVRLREIAFRWNLRPILVKSAPLFESVIRELSVGIALRNLALWTEYSGIDTEFNSPGTVPSEAQAQATDRWVLVQPRAFQFTLNLGF
ncbi:MAG: TonB-dependent receptor [Candidatus Kapabacteria bacterium]|jgi:TonB-dependent SusC/RagA subfamily outer membrane receptor|nr:TonB-dependent receptor [Candidatus Kapabacteria bacterium]